MFTEYFALYILRQVLAMEYMTYNYFMKYMKAQRKIAMAFHSHP